MHTIATLIDAAWAKFLARKVSWWASVWTIPKNFMMFPTMTSNGALDSLPRSGLQLLSNAYVRCNVLMTVSRQVAPPPPEVYNFLKSLGVRYIQFNLVVERLIDDGEKLIGLHFSKPPGLPKKIFKVPCWLP